MKKEYRQAIAKGIKESNNLNGYKWKVTPTGLDWEYGEQFVFTNYSNEFLIVKGRQSGMTVATVLIGNSKYDHVKTMVEAYELATLVTIDTANHLY